MAENLFARMTKWLWGGEIRRQVRALMAESENNFMVGARRFDGSERDRHDYDREEILDEALDAWRVNPLARRIVGLTSQYVVGGGVEIACRHAPTRRFLKAFWEHSLNRLEVKIYEWCDELTRSGNLFLLLSTDAAGMSYVRAVPTRDVKEIQSPANDYDQETGYVLRSSEDEVTYPAWQAGDDAPDEQGAFQPVMLHYAINRPAGGQWGESDLAPLLRWLARYANWLEDRARLNRYRNTFLYVVKARFVSEVDRAARQAQLATNQPSTGSILVVDESETWEVISPKLESADANTDGLALKKMIASGAGLPLHFLAEPESATRTTAEASGGPTYRHFEQRQKFFLWLLSDLLRVVAHRRRLVDRQMLRDAEVKVTGGDISARDNLSLAMAASNMVAVLGDLRDRGLIDDSEMLRLVYRFSGESADLADLLEKGREAGKAAGSPARRPVSRGKGVDIVSGEEKPEKEVL
jgi:hypothetical protein